MNWNVAPTARDVTINGSRVFPESITHDAQGNLYNASTGGTIYRTRAGAGTAEPWVVPGPDNALKSLFGVMADNARRLLWTCNNPNIFAGERGVSSLLAFDLSSALQSARYDFPADGPAACNDIAIARDGAVWVSETSGGRIFVLRPHANELELFAKDEALVGIDGLAFSGDGTLYINNVRKNLFQRVERKADGSYAGLTDLTVPVQLGGPDGLRSLGGNRFIQGEGTSGRVAVLTVSGNSVTVTDVVTGLNGPVGVTVVGREAYVVEGKIGYLFDPKLKDQNPDPFVIRAFPLPVVK
ncbi:hypothetical protein GRI89_09640 [Altererythrobacter salegens]|uniref:SMP-30/Gluconolactonase/LRE-like region domain-containing protein n=1 Tax=Croceibacterium salegens TaxID=1737568 RepID=A0A6I4SV80_9SPHN|nr:hypothetical protein [Croceibacterium salegens]MXO59801.1 hypothetical protein [Croceibacterium salegens]